MQNLTQRNYIFVSGLPRSGSTVFCNILAQNPRFRSDAVTSGLAGILTGVKENWEKNESFRSWPDPDAKARVLKGMFHAYYSNTDHPVVVDKSRQWPRMIETLEMILGKKPKIILCVRDMRSIMSSWEKMWRRNSHLFTLNIPPEAQPTVESRVQHWGSSKDHTGQAYLTIQDALSRGHKNCMLFVDFDKLTRDPVGQMRRVYDFIGEDHFNHNFVNIEQKNIEFDPVPWMKDLHVIRKSLTPTNPDWEHVLGSPANGLAQSNKLWESFT